MIAQAQTQDQARAQAPAPAQAQAEANYWDAILLRELERVEEAIRSGNVPPNIR